MGQTAPFDLSLLYRYGIIDLMEDSYTTRPVVGRLIALDFRPARPLTLLGPAWAALCGAVASGALTLSSQTLFVLILLLLLCDALLGAWRALWLHADWRTAFARNRASAQVWLTPSEYEPTAFFRRVTWNVSRQVHFARSAVWPLIDSEIIGMMIAGVVALCLAVVLGLAPTILTALALVLALIEGQVGAARGAELRALFEIALPWLIGQSAFGYFSGLALVFILLFTLAYRALLGVASARQSRWLVWSNVTQLGVVFLLIVSSAPVGAGVVGLGLLAQMLWQVRYRVDRDGGTYAQRVQSYMLVGMLVTGLSLWL
jgi:hypothetical protein